VAFGAPDQPYVGGVQADQQCALGAAEVAVPDQHGRDQRDGQGEQGVAAHAGAEWQRGNQGAQAEGDGAHGHIGADHVAVGDGGHVPQRGGHRGGQLLGFGAGQQQRQRKVLTLSPAEASARCSAKVSAPHTMAATLARSATGASRVCGTVVLSSGRPGRG
jgi:hypothetical protein